MKFIQKIILFVLLVLSSSSFLFPIQKAHSELVLQDHLLSPLSCRSVPDILSKIKRAHVSTLNKSENKKRFDNKRIVSILVEEIFNYLDPHRHLFVQEEMESFKKTLNDNISEIEDQLFNKGQCNFVYPIERFINKANKRYANFINLILNQSEKTHFYWFDHYKKLSIENSSQPWPKNRFELVEKIKFGFINDYRKSVEVNNLGKEESYFLAKKHLRQYLKSTVNVGQIKWPQTLLKVILPTLDPHTRYFSQEEFKNYTRSAFSGFVGVGISYRERRHGMEILKVYENSPSAKAGLKKGDVIYKVENFLVKDHSLEFFYRYVEGPLNVPLKVQVLRKGKMIPATIVRGRVESKKDSIQGKILKSSSGSRVGLIKIPEFYSPVWNKKNKMTVEGSYSDFRSELIKIEKKNIDSLIIDLRSNPGGSLDEATKIASLFVSSRTIVFQHNGMTRQVIPHQSRSKPTDSKSLSFVERIGLFTKPVFVLVNKETASSAELLAGSLKVWNRAILIGEHKKTFGKGSIFRFGSLKNLLRLPVPGGLALTFAAYYLPDGKSVLGHGIEPDVFIPVVDKSTKDYQSERELPYAFTEINDLDISQIQTKVINYFPKPECSLPPKNEADVIELSADQKYYKCTKFIGYDQLFKSGRMNSMIGKMKDVKLLSKIISSDHQYGLSSQAWSGKVIQWIQVWSAAVTRNTLKAQNNLNH